MEQQIVSMLLSMGYEEHYIFQAIELHKQSKLGTKYNFDILVEIISKLKRRSIEIEEKEKFIPHYMNTEEPLKLNVNDFIDYRYENGRFVLCKVIAKSETLNSMLLLHPCGKPMHDTKHDRLIDIYEEYHKLAPSKSICLKKIQSKKHIFYNIKVNDYIDINPVWKNGHQGWKNAKIVKLDTHSSQVKASYYNKHDNKYHLYWVHLENKLEVAPYKKHNNDIDNKVDESNKSQNPYLDSGLLEGLQQFCPTQNKHFMQEHKNEMKTENETETDDNFVLVNVDNDNEDNKTDLACYDIDDDNITSYLLKFDESKWDFNNNLVEVYRLQSQLINHELMLPNPISISFPEYFSSMTIPPKYDHFVAEIFTPKNKLLFPTNTNKWKEIIYIVIDKTTSKVLIDTIVQKFKS
eukprot:465034_1